MKILNCPLNGPRNISEFTYGGEFHRMPDPKHSADHVWAEHVFFHDNEAGIVTEWWFHNATSFWFLAERNTITDEVVRTFCVNELFNERVEFINDADPSANAEVK